MPQVAPREVQQVIGKPGRRVESRQPAYDRSEQPREATERPACTIKTQGTCLKKARRTGSRRRVELSGMDCVGLRALEGSGRRRSQQDSPAFSRRRRIDDFRLLSPWPHPAAVLLRIPHTAAARFFSEVSAALRL